MTIHLICLTKSYNIDDFRAWYSYYKMKLSAAKIHVIDNESAVDLTEIVEHDEYEKLTGWPNQWELFDTILNENRYGFNDGDFVMFLDDDEFLWADNLEEAINSEFSKSEFDVVLVPQILMSMHRLPVSRACPYTFSHYYRRNDLSSQGKSIIRFDENVKYRFANRDVERGHVPFMKFKNGGHYFRFSKVVGSGFSKSTYGLVAYEASLRLYHFHLKSEVDWEMKWKRGSAACHEHPYKEELKENKYFGGYDVPDMTIRNEFEKLQK